MKTDANCIFCKIVAGQMPCFKLLEDLFTAKFLQIALEDRQFFAGLRPEAPNDQHSHVEETGAA